MGQTFLWGNDAADHWLTTAISTIHHHSQLLLACVQSNGHFNNATPHKQYTSCFLVYTISNIRFVLMAIIYVCMWGTPTQQPLWHDKHTQCF